MKKFKFIGNEYELISNDRDCFNEEEAKEKITDYFADYDYIFGDYAYDKLRLKGYYDSNNKNVSNINDIKGIENYKADYCSYGARTFLLKKLK